MSYLFLSDGAEGHLIRALLYKVEGDSSFTVVNILVANFGRPPVSPAVRFPATEGATHQSRVATGTHAFNSHGVAAYPDMVVHQEFRGLRVTDFRKTFGS